MEIAKLWEKISPIQDNLEQIKRDLKEGRVPELPFFVVDMKKEKAKIGEYLSKIDITLQTCIITSIHGNGKTNLMKYLKLLTKDNPNVQVVYTRADIDQYDIVLFLLKLIQDNLIDELEKSIKYLQEKKIDISKLANDYEDSFGAIKEYALKLSSESDNEKIRKLISLGTGRLYSKGNFNEFNLAQLTDFNRREVLVLFLNIIALRGKYIIFQIDELEKIQEKSKIRFSHFLTSYRELIDLSSLIKGHFLFTSFTDSLGNSSVSFETYNPAFLRRVEDRIIQLPLISDLEDLIELTRNLKDLLSPDRVIEISKIAKSIKKENFNKNSQIVKYICNSLIDNGDIKTLDILLSEFSLTDLFNETKSRLDMEESFKRINSKFFDPLEDYLLANNYLKKDITIKSQGEQAYINKEFNSISVFLFNSDFDSNFERILNIYNEYKDKKIIIYCPIGLDLTYSRLVENDIKDVEIIEYDPESLMTLLVMFRDENLEHGLKIKKVVFEYTNKNL